MAEAFKKRWVLFAVLLIFICLKIPHLFKSFYWDESWPYASGVMQMYLNGPSLMPGSISGELARGHPLMFHFLAAMWLKIFGTSHVAMHAYPLFISVLFLIAIYEAGLRLFDTRVAIIAIVVVASQQIFFVQSSFLLLEMQTAFLGFVSIFFYVSRKYLLTAISLTMLFYTKESGMIVGFILGIDAIVSLFTKDESIKHRVFRFLSIAIPVVLIGIFFLLQKHVSGWYVLPLYANGLEMNYQAFYNKFRDSYKFLIRNDHRIYFFHLLVMVSLLTAIWSKKIKYALPVIGVFLIFFVISDKWHSLIHKDLMPPLFSAAFIALVYSICRLLGLSSLQRKFVMLLALFVIVFAVFASINLYFIHRYLLIALIPVLFIGAVFISYLSGRLSKYSLLPILVIVAAISGWSYVKDRTLSDGSLGAFDGLYVHEHLVSFMEDRGYHKKAIASEGYLERIHLLDPYSGFLKENRPFEDVKWDITPKTEVIIFDNIEPDLRYEQIKNGKLFRRIYRVQKGEAWGEIYIRMQANP